jgi:hypothetical protein
VPAGAFSQTVRLTQTVGFQRDVAPAGPLASTNHWFDIAAAYASTGAPADLQQPMTVTIHYAEAERAGLVEESLGLYRSQGQAWLPAASDSLDVSANIITATVDVLGRWALLGETRRVYLPLAIRGQP